MGYHYWAAIYDSSENLVTGTYSIISGTYHVALRHPKEATLDIEYEVGEETLDFDPDPDQPRYIAIASSVYNGAEKTIACFKTDRVEDEELNSHLLLYYKRFRGAQQNAQGVIEDFDTKDGFTAEIMSVKMTTGTGASGTMSKPIYCATMVIWGTMPSAYIHSLIKVYRYEPSQDSWVNVAEYLMTPQNEWDHFVDVAIAADGNDLVVFWITEYLTGSDKLWGYMVDDAATTTGKCTFSETSTVVRTGDFGNIVNADWDTNLSKPRITWLEKTGSYYDTWAARVTFDAQTGHPNGTQYPYEIFDDSSYDSVNPCITVSHAEGVYTSTTDNIYEAFTSLTCNNVAVRVDLQASSGSDSWQTPDEFKSGIIDRENHITYRYLGPPKYVCTTSTEIQTDHEVLEKGPSQSLEGARICTNRDNRKDMFVTFNNTNKARVQIIQLEP